MLLWRNRLARMTVNHEVAGSSPAGSVFRKIFRLFGLVVKRRSRKAKIEGSIPSRASFFPGNFLFIF